MHTRTVVGGDSRHMAGQLLVVAAHGAHALLVVGGAVAVAALLWRPKEVDVEQVQRVQELRHAAEHGQLVSAAVSRAASDPRRARQRPAPARDIALAALASVAAAGMHAAVGPDHLSQSFVAGLFFFVAAALQIGWSLAALRSPRPAVLRAGLTCSASLIFLWLLSRSVGIPEGLGGEGVEAVGVSDLLATASEAIVLVVCARRLWAPGLTASSRSR